VSAMCCARVGEARVLLTSVPRQWATLHLKLWIPARQQRHASSGLDRARVTRVLHGLCPRGRFAAAESCGLVSLR